MSTTLTNGLKLPDKGSVDWYADMQNNYAILDGAVGTVAEHTTQIAGKAPLVHIHTKSDITDFPALANVATSGSYNDLSNIPASFTPSSHTHGNITNDGKVGTTANLPLITGTGGVVQAGSFGNAANTFCEGNDSRLSDARTPVAHTHTKSDVTDLLNSNFIPSANNSYDLGSSSYQWNNLYAKNYYYNGTAWGLDKENTWSNYNRFNGYRLHIKSYSQEIGVLPTSNQWNGFSFTDKNNNQTVSFEHALMPGETRFKISMVDNVASHNSNSTVWIEFLRLTAYAEGSGFVVGSELRPLNNNLNLGTSTNKWKTLNGVNPGALSLPNSSYDNISTQNWVKRPSSSDGGFVCNIVPSVNGWVCIQVTREKDFGVWIVGTFRQSFHAVQTSATTYVAMLCFPALASSGINIYTNAVETDDADLTFNIARIYPCLGNV